LLENGADPRVPDIYGKTPLRYARKYGNKEAVKLIKKYLKK
jgi:ankyrin repeat protein